MVPQTAD